MFGSFQIISFNVNIFKDKPLFQYHIFSKQKILFWNRKWIYCGILWPFQNIFVSFPFPKKHFSTGRPIQTENCSRFKREVFFPDQPFYQKNPVGMKPMVGMEWHGLFWWGFVWSPLKNGLRFQPPPPCWHMQPWGCDLLVECRAHGRVAVLSHMFSIYRNVTLRGFVPAARAEAREHIF